MFVLHFDDPETVASIDANAKMITLYRRCRSRQALEKRLHVTDVVEHGSLLANGCPTRHFRDTPQTRAAIAALKEKELRWINHVLDTRKSTRQFGLRVHSQGPLSLLRLAPSAEKFTHLDDLSKLLSANTHWPALSRGQIKDWLISSKASKKGIRWFQQQGEPFWNSPKMVFGPPPKTSLRTLADIESLSLVVQRCVRVAHTCKSSGYPTPLAYKDAMIWVRSVQATVVEGSLRDDFDEGTESLAERCRQLENHFEMLLHDLRNRLKVKIVLDEKNRGFIVKRSDWKKVKPQTTALQIKKHSVLLTTAAFTDLSNGYLAYKSANSAIEKEHVERLQATAAVSLLLKQAVILDAERSVSAATRGWCWPTPAAAFHLKGAFHPLLAPETVIPFDLTFKGVLVVTGWNSSGKSTLARAIATIALLARANLPVPATDATVPLIDGLGARAGITSSGVNSTFMGHMVQVANLLESATSSTLLCLDELGASTDAKNGRALAKAIAAHLAERAVPTIVTTHFVGLVPPGGTSVYLDQQHRLHYGAIRSDALSYVAQRWGF